MMTQPVVDLAVAQETDRQAEFVTRLFTITEAYGFHRNTGGVMSWSTFWMKECSRQDKANRFSFANGPIPQQPNSPYDLNGLGREAQKMEADYNAYLDDKAEYMAMQAMGFTYG